MRGTYQCRHVKKSLEQLKRKIIPEFQLFSCVIYLQSRIWVQSHLERTNLFTKVKGLHFVYLRFSKLRLLKISSRLFECKSKLNYKTQWRTITTGTYTECYQARILNRVDDENWNCNRLILGKNTVR